MRSYLITMLFLIMCGCDGDAISNGRVKAIEVPVTTEVPTEEPTPEPTEAPTLQDIQVYEVLEPFRTICEESELEACGITFSSCDDGHVYICYHNVTYKVKTKKVYR